MSDLAIFAFGCGVFLVVGLAVGFSIVGVSHADLSDSSEPGQPARPAKVDAVARTGREKAFSESGS